MTSPFDPFIRQPVALSHQEFQNRLDFVIVILFSSALKLIESKSAVIDRPQRLRPSAWVSSANNLADPEPVFADHFR